MNFPPSSKAAILREARVGRITCVPRVELALVCSWISYSVAPHPQRLPSVAASHLFEDDRLLVPHRVDGVVVLGGFGLQRLPPGVHGEPEHLHLHVHAHAPLSQELARDHLGHETVARTHEKHSR